MFTLLTTMNFVRLLECELKFFISIRFPNSIISKLKYKTNSIVYFRFILSYKIYRIVPNCIQIIHPYRYFLNIEYVKLKSKKLRYDKINSIKLKCRIVPCIQNIHPEIKIKIKKKN